MCRNYRVENDAGRTHEGTGIGLALVREFLALHQGTVQAQSTVGEGSTFTVTLPHRSTSDNTAQNAALQSGRVAPPAVRTRAFVAEAEHMLTAHSAMSTSTAAGAAHIVLADDNADMRNYILHLLAGHYSVVAVKDGNAALRAIREQRTDLLLSDIMMPGMDGFQLLAALRQDPALRTLPVILLSARAAEESRIDSFNLRADDYLTKPFSAKELLARIDKQLAMVRMRQEVATQQAAVDLLAQQRAWLRMVMDLVPMPLLLLETPSGRVSFCNQAAHTMAGGALSLEKSFIDLPPPFRMVQPNGAPFLAAEHPVQRALGNTRLRDAEVLWQTPVDSFHLLMDAQPVGSVPGEPASVVLCMRDVTRIHGVQRELERMVRVRDDFLSVASHELKTPLTSLTLQTQMALRRLGPARDVSPPVQVLVKLLHHTNLQLRRLAKLVDDMLDITHVDSGQFKLHRKPCRRFILSPMARRTASGIVLASSRWSPTSW